MKSSVQMELVRAREMHQVIADRLAGSYPCDDRRSLFAGLISLSQSHHEAILLLAETARLRSSAFALFRPLVEAAYRGLFIAFLADDEQVQLIKTGGEPYGHFNKLAARLDVFFNTDELFAQYGGESWKILNGYTHGGFEQIARRIDADGRLGDHFSEDEIKSLLASSTSLLTRTAIPLLQILQRVDAAHEISLRYLALYPVPEVDI